MCEHTRRRRLAAVTCLAVVLAIGGCSSGGETAEPDEPARCDHDGTAELVAGEHTFESDGQERTYLLALPEEDDGTTPHPLLLSFHGWSLDKNIHEGYTAMAEHGTARGYVVVTPDARERTGSSPPTRASSPPPT